MCLTKVFAQSVGEEGFVVRDLSNNSGLYVEDVAKIRFYHQEWKIVTYVNMTEYQAEFDGILENVNTVINRCSVLEERLNSIRNCDRCDAGLYCDTILYQITGLLDDLQENDAKWWVRTNKRSKRGLINAIGILSNQLFGILSQDDAADYLARFENIHKENRERDEIVEAQTSLLEFTIRFVNQSAVSNGEIFRKINDQFRVLALEVDGIKKQIDLHGFTDLGLVRDLRTSIHDITIEILVSMTRFGVKQRKFLNALSLGQKHANSPLLIAPATFVAELYRIRDSIASEDLDLPLPISVENLAQYYHMATP